VAEFLRRSEEPQVLEASDVFEHIQRAAELIMEPGSVQKLRIPKVGREKTTSGYFDDPLKLARCAAKLDATGRYAGVYITLKPCYRREDVARWIETRPTGGEAHQPATSKPLRNS
jgi:hypothetical protein